MSKALLQPPKVQRRSLPKHRRPPLRLFHRSLRKLHNPLVPPTRHQPETINEATDQLARIRLPTPVETKIEELPKSAKPLPPLAMSLNPDGLDADRDRIDRHQAVSHSVTMGDETAGSATMDDATAGSGRSSASALALAACRFFEEIQETASALAVHPATTMA